MSKLLKVYLKIEELDGDTYIIRRKGSFSKSIRVEDECLEMAPVHVEILIKTLGTQLGLTINDWWAAGQEQAPDWEV
jgi:hypothetical protein